MQRHRFGEATFSRHIMIRIGLLAGATMLAGLAGVFQAQAADIPGRTLVASPPAIAAFNPWMVRVRGLYVMPNDGSKVFAGGALVPGGATNISNTFVPELDITYFFTPNIAAELILGVTPHSARAVRFAVGAGQAGFGHAAATDPDAAISLHRPRRDQALCRRRRKLHDLLRREGCGPDQLQGHEPSGPRAAGRRRHHDRQELGPELRREEALSAARGHRSCSA